MKQPKSSDEEFPVVLVVAGSFLVFALVSILVVVGALFIWVRGRQLEAEAKRRSELQRAVIAEQMVGEMEALNRALEEQTTRVQQQFEEAEAMTEESLRRATELMNK